jgi:flagellar biosynthesis protein FlhA
MRRVLSQAGAGIVVLAVAMLVVPLPPPVLDVLFLVNLSLSLVVTVVALETPEPLEFSGFPSLLLLTTLLRIALDVSAARSILLTANAGTVVQAFGSFVVGQNPVVGILIFLLLFIVQYLVITRGAERVAEVAARFTLDAMAGKQMAIDADLHAGAITDQEARARRARIAQEADFYGAMDGATKYVRGDAIATLVVLLVNTVAGLAVGMIGNHLSFADAVDTYTTLAIGNALISQLPAFLLSTAAGVLVTRSGSQRAGLSEVLGRQLAGRHQPLYIVAVFLAAIGLLLPVSPVTFVLAGILAYLGWRVQHRPAPETAPPARPAVAAPKPGEQLPDPVSVSVGYGLVKMADPAQGGELFQRLEAVTTALSRELGFQLPPPRLRDDLSLAPNQYRIQVRSLTVAEGTVFPDRDLLLAARLPEVPGAVSGTDPVYHLPALWVPAAESQRLAAEGHMTTPAAAVIAAHYRQALEGRAYLLFDRQATQALLDRVRQVDRAAVEELVPGLLSLTAVHAVLQNLLRESVSIQDGVTIVETLADAAQHGTDVLVLTERVRQALAPMIRSRLAREGRLELVTLPKPLETAAEQAIRTVPEPGLDMEPRLLAGLLQALKRVQTRSEAVALLVPPKLRPFFARLLELHLPGFPVLSVAEIDPAATYHVETVEV